MTDPEGFYFEDVWQDIPATVKEDLINFWLGEGALPSRELAEQRLDQVCYLAREGQGGPIAAVSTVYRQFNQRLGHPFYYFRCYVGQAHRRKLLAARLLVNVRDKLNARFQAGDDPKAIGMIVEVENQALNEQHRKAVWEHSGFTFIGYNRRNQQVRLYYFTGARV